MSIYLDVPDKHICVYGRTFIDNQALILPFALIFDLGDSSSLCHT